MPTDPAVLLDWVFDVIDELNPLLPEERRLAKSQDTILFGENGQLDSLDLVRLIMAVEEKVNDSTGAMVILADDRAMSQARSPFQTISTLVDYVALLLDEAADGG